MIGTQTPPPGGVPPGGPEGAMSGFIYQHGDRPLEGYTIQRAIGRGGFGEVYYALSDSGRQVAIKAVLTHEQIELRGIGHCMNLKSPHLVTIHDVRHGEHGRPFVVMEYVNGPSLRELLDAAPAGLGTPKAAFFLREIAKGLTFLHDCGIVHRDLKPGNIFYEDGYVKIGDYGLAKAISASVNSGQTMTVGTLHYMAPEVGAGKYDRSIDIYALGCILYEMLTGQPPYLGQSPGEILMKHLTAEPDLSGIEEPLATAVRRALAKNVEQRFQSVQEMVEAVFGTEHIRQSVSHFRPEELSVVAAHVAGKVLPGTGAAGTPKSSTRVPPIFAALAATAEAGAVADPISTNQRYSLWLIAAGIVGVAAGALAGQGRDFIPLTLTGFTMILGASFGLALARRRVVPSLEPKDASLARLAYVGLAMISGVMCAAVPIMIGLGIGSAFLEERLARAVLAIGASMLLVNWHQTLSPNRSERLVSEPAWTCGFIAFIAAFIFGGGGSGAMFAAAVSAGVALAVQTLAPYDPSAPRTKESVANTTGSHPSRLSEAIAAVARPPASYPQPHPMITQATAEHRPLRPQGQHPWAVSLSHDAMSHRSWLATLLLALVPFLMIPLCGIHRFYAGKIGTGLLWLCTAGLFGVGQIIDIILIGCGAFKDKQGRRIVASPQAFGRPDEERTDHTGQIYVRDPMSPTAVGLTLVSSLMIIAGWLLAAALAVGVPDMIAAGVFNFAEPNLNVQLAQEFGYDKWARVAYKVGGLTAGMLLFLGTAIMGAARSGSGLIHIFRGVVGMVALGLAIIPLYAAFQGVGNAERRFEEVANQFDAGKFWAGIDQLVLSEETLLLLFVAAMIVLASLVLLLIPRRGRWVPAQARETGTMRDEGGAS